MGTIEVGGKNPKLITGKRPIPLARTELDFSSVYISNKLNGGFYRSQLWREDFIRVNRKSSPTRYGFRTFALVTKSGISQNLAVNKLTARTQMGKMPVLHRSKRRLYRNRQSL